MLTLYEYIGSFAFVTILEVEALLSYDPKGDPGDDVSKFSMSKIWVGRRFRTLFSPLSVAKHVRGGESEEVYLAISISFSFYIIRGEFITRYPLDQYR
jgi:hypothetical protein